MNPNARIAGILANIGFETTSGCADVDNQTWTLPGTDITAERERIWVTIHGRKRTVFSVYASGTEGLIRKAISES